MKATAKINLIRFASILFIVLFTACGDYFVNPLKDKETGEDFNLLVVDFNFFKTRMTYNIKDAKTGEIITADALVKFTGKNGNDIVNYSGVKNPQYQTALGQLELTVDPNVPISPSTPFEVTVNVEINGYNSLNKTLTLQSDGIKTIELLLAKTSDETNSNHTGDIKFGTDTIFHFSTSPLKSQKTSDIPFKIDYEITLYNLLKFKDEMGNLLFKNDIDAMTAYNSDPENFIKVSFSKYNDYQPGVEMVNLNGTTKNALFHKLETGNLTSLLIAGKKVGSLNGGLISAQSSNASDFLPKIMGFAGFENNAWKMFGTNNQHSNLNFGYTLATVSTEELCNTGCSILFKSNVISSFAITGDVYDADNKLITTMYFKGSFPQTFVLENVPSKAAKMVFRNNNPSFKAMPDLQISNLCSGSYMVSVEAETGYSQFQIVLKAFCRDNKTIAIAPTYSAEIKLSGSTNPWQLINMKGGVVDVLGKPDADYDLRLLWQNEWEYSSYSTKFDANGNYLGEPKKDAKVTSRKLPDDRMQISVEKIFNQNVCNDLGWQ